jgi:hypothetical protein
LSQPEDIAELAVFLAEYPLTSQMQKVVVKFRLVP